MDNVTKLLQSFWKRPFNPEGSVVDWFLFIGLVILLFFLWGRIVNKIA